MVFGPHQRAGVYLFFPWVVEELLEIKGARGDGGGKALTRRSALPNLRWGRPEDIVKFFEDVPWKASRLGFDGFAERF